MTDRRRRPRHRGRGKHDASSRFANRTGPAHSSFGQGRSDIPAPESGSAPGRSRLGAWPTSLAPRLGAEWVILLYLFCLLCIPSRLVFAPLGSLGTPANVVALLALLWWFLATIGGQNPVRRITPLRIGVLLLTLAVLVAAVAGTAKGWWAPPSLRQASDEDWTLIPVTGSELVSKMTSAIDRGLVTYAGWVGILLMTAEGMRSWAGVDRVLTWGVRLACVPATIGIAQFYFDLDLARLIEIPGLSASSDIGAIDSRSVLNRVSSTATHPIEFGVAMVSFSFLALHRAIFKRRLLTWLPVVLIGLAAAMTVSRSAILAGALGGVVLFVAWPTAWRRRAIIALPFAVVGVRLAAPGLVGTIRSLFENLGNDPSITGRTSDYGPVVALFAENPWIGRGLFTFVPRYYRIIDNQVLMILLEIGVMGLLAFLVLTLAAILEARLVLKRSAIFERRMVAAVLLAALAAVLGSYFTFDAWSFPMVGGLTFLLLGLCGAIGGLECVDRTEGCTLGATTVPMSDARTRPVEVT